MVYLASPYSDDCPGVREHRYDQAMEAARELAGRGVVVYSPIMHWHCSNVRYGDPHDFEAWRNQDEGMISVASSLWILMLPGWRESKGVAAETAIAVSLGKPVWYLNPATLEITKAPPLAA